MLWKDAIGRRGAHCRKNFLKTVFNSIKSTLSHMCESRVWKNFETPFYSFKVDSFFGIFSGFRFLFSHVFFNVAWLSQVCFGVYLPIWAYIKLLTMFSPFILSISNSFLRTNKTFFNDRSQGYEQLHVRSLLLAQIVVFQNLSSHIASAVTVVTY